jgi:hypothetical protein
MRELQVLGNDHLKLDFGEWREFFEIEMAEQLRSQLKALIEQALEAESDYYLQLNYYEHAPQCRLDYRNGYYFRDLVVVCTFDHVCVELKFFPVRIPTIS